ncbi:MAG: type II toxin-antitoxin system Phd/YefM family antitoxin [Acholeplasmataceae bacterium]|jgi:antitoxin Phd|nr:type II toxin-antitoxin system Phd/YefM family antitoxin [Acholeplasmataceae bacterium]
MTLKVQQIISMTEANQNFSKVSRTVDKYGNALILKNNKPKYVIINYEKYLDLTEDEMIEIVSKRLFKKHINAYRNLAK